MSRNSLEAGVSLPALSKEFRDIQANYTGFPTCVVNMGDEGGAQVKTWGELKMLSKNTCEGVYLIVKLPGISLQASKFTKNELLQTYFSRILARF